MSAIHVLPSSIIDTQSVQPKMLVKVSHANYRNPENFHQQNASIMSNQQMQLYPPSSQRYYLSTNSPSIKQGSIKTDAFEDTIQNSNLSKKDIFTQQTCDSTCVMSGTPYRPSTIAYWPFNGNLYDSNNIYSGIYMPTTSSPSYVVGDIDQSISLNGTSYVLVNSHFLNLSYRSWTIEAWIFLYDVTTEHGIFSQCQSSTTTDKCLNIGVKNKRLYCSFYNDDVYGATFLTASSTKWYHIAFVYDYSLMKQSIYLNGVLDGTTWTSGTSSGPYKGTTGTVTIGREYSGYYFKGDIDHLQVTSVAKTACQILQDASLTAYYSFDVDVLNLDLSNNYINGLSNSISTVSGRINEGYLFQGTSAYFQTTAFTAYRSGRSFSVSLWVKPYSVVGGTLIHLSTNNDGSGTACFDLLGFSSTGQLIANLYYSDGCCVWTCSCHYSTSIGGPFINTTIWTHIVLTYSSSNGMALYTNGTLNAVSDAFTSFSTNVYAFTSRPYMTVGNPSNTAFVPSGCLTASPALSPGHYQGVIDDLRIYSRELTTSEICSLFNP
ncbi:unnamed protein product [Rotaria sp. Silwood1]|nr:unnamed protein product [Rotaria sp. Silwood1]CAF1641762.1 unnamed protein product [Rotaria sp. Silwood1]CAF3782461.1 unnamed protein product [Rotaria sp. Silwood1]CAF4771892.1 unnamed protein product [Rotaria sp. Silwood1]